MKSIFLARKLKLKPWGLLYDIPTYPSDSDSVGFMTPLSTQIFDFHHHKHSYDSDSDFVASENQPKVLKLLKLELECQG